MEANLHGNLKREFRARDAFIIAFVFVSPIVALYGVFGLVLTTAGPVGWWAFLIVMVLQLAVAGTLGLMVSRWPVQGGSYQWARRLAGANYGWATGWMYLWTLVTAMASAAYFIAGLLPSLVDHAPFTVGQQTLAALCVIACVTALNVLGPKTLKIFTRASLVAEVLGSVGLATVLLIWHRKQPLSVITETAGATPHHYVWMGFFFAIGVAGYSFAGWESVCSMAEEIKDPERHLPKAMMGAILAIGVLVLYSSLALILAVPDLPAVMAGQVHDPATDTIVATLGSGVAKPFLVLILIGFMAGLVAAQTTVGRVLWSFGRDGTVPAAKFLVKLSGKHHYPVRSLVAIGIMTAAVTVSAFSEKIYTTLISASTAGFFVTMALVICALIRRVLTGRFQYGLFTFGRVTPAIVLAAGVWASFEVVNLCWPRASDQPWYVAWAVPLGLAIIALLGLVVRLTLPGFGAALGATEPEAEEKLVAPPL
ncbi:APC family permease [Streptomyces sp. NPDC001663]|uniref:APC family permease n=1 Tax=Streptomyces sp. NPDC001663 TaxID=3364597 RepID=UPI0036B3F31C